MTLQQRRDKWREEAKEYVCMTSSWAMTELDNWSDTALLNHIGKIQASANYLTSDYIINVKYEDNEK